MGEKALPPQENMETSSSDNDNHDIDVDEDENYEIQDVASEEFQEINTQLDALNSALDNIEQKNDVIHAELLQLLQSNREIRQQLQQSNNLDNTVANQ